MTRGPSELRALRSAARLTQQQLAVLAGLHVRTVRGLETGRIISPRRSTVDLIARALGLDVRRHIRLLAAWGLRDIGPVDSGRPPLSTQTYSDIEQSLARSSQQTMAAAVAETIEIGPDQRASRRHTQEVVVALEDGAVARSLFYDPEDPAVDATRLHLTDLENGCVMRESVDESGKAKLFEISLGQRLSVGESHILRYTVDFAAARVDEPGRRPDGGREIGGFLRSPALYLLEVRFDANALPRRCEQIFQPRPHAPAQVTTRLRLTNEHVAHIALINPKPGGHGIAWQW